MDPEGPRPPPPEEAPYAGVRRSLDRAVASVCPRWLADRRDDIVQVAMMRILRLSNPDGAARELSPAYLRRTAYSALVDEIRRVRRRREAPLSDSRRDREPADGPPTPEQEVVGREIGEAIHECLARLVRPRRLAVTLHLQGHTVPEAAELLDYGRKRTENLVYRGLADLRRCLAAKGLEP